jgi:hypothetical protein
MRSENVPKHICCTISSHAGGDAKEKGNDIQVNYGIAPSHQDFDKKLAEVA